METLLSAPRRYVLASQPQMWALAMMSAAGPPRALPRGRARLVEDSGGLLCMLSVVCAESNGDLLF